MWEQHAGQCICSAHCLLWISQGLSWALQACIAEQGFEEIYRRFDSTPGNTISIQGQVHVAVRTLLAKYGVDRSQGAVTSITTTGAGLLHDHIHPEHRVPPSTWALSTQIVIGYRLCHAVHMHTLPQMSGLHRVAAGIQVFVASEVLQLAASPGSTVHTTGSCTLEERG